MLLLNIINQPRFNVIRHENIGIENKSTKDLNCEKKLSPKRAFKHTFTTKNYAIVKTLLFEIFIVLDAQQSSNGKEVVEPGLEA